MTTYPVAFDEDQYPISLSQQQKAVIALARQQNGEIRTRDLVQQFGWNRFKAHNVLYRLRKRGVFHSQLIWSTTKNGNHVVSKDKDGQRRNLHSWLVCRLQPVEVWGQEPDVFCSNFHPTHPQRIRKEI